MSGDTIALASLAAFVLVQTGAACLAIGGLFARMKTVEKGQEGSDNCAVQLAAVNATLEAMKSTLANVEHNIKNLWQALPATRRKAAE